MVWGIPDTGKYNISLNMEQYIVHFYRFKLEIAYADITITFTPVEVSSCPINVFVPENLLIFGSIT